MRKLWCLVLLCVASVTQANLVIEITQGRDDAVSIAVVPFAHQGSSVSEDVAQIIGADLHRSGLFAPIDRADLLSRPSQERDIIWRDFRVLKSEYLVIGRVEEEQPGQFKIAYELHDVDQGNKVLAASYRANEDQFRDVAHSIADKIFEQLTGIPGAFNTKILYVTVNDKDSHPYQLQYADADGHRTTTILRSKEPIMSPSWAPDGRRVAYVSFEGDGLPKIYVHNLLTAERRVVSQADGINGAPSWSPDGQQLALTLSKDGHAQIYTLDLRTNELTRRTHTRTLETEARWMPDGQSIVFTSGRSGGPQVYELNLNSGKTKRLTFNGPYNARPDITPDGRHLVFVHRKEGKYQIGVQDLHRGTFNVLTTSNMDESPSVAPNGIMVIYGTQDKGAGVLEAISVDGKVKVALPSKEGEVREPAWSPFL